ncbi:hypothetical protein BJ508DRAFT_325602 [Ascobolus immersus RN42]|uniref:Uncharacterized protein n=1 Tax=Ascobolus immersus RN42 TaxID=1160509 RepID=A0A3N4IDP6_ASCIM|nr:hypothetical protein BJ508DRAFT_325602 [Ascobolus immersus RN42]
MSESCSMGSERVSQTAGSAPTSPANRRGSTSYPSTAPSQEATNPNTSLYEGAGSMVLTAAIQEGGPVETQYNGASERERPHEDTAGLGRLAQAAQAALEEQKEEYREEFDVRRNMVYYDYDGEQPGDSDSEDYLEVSNACYNSKTCFYSQQCLQLNINETLRSEVHWCKHYLFEMKTGARIAWLPGHKEGMMRFCIHYSWYGEGKMWKNHSQQQMAVKLLEEIGGCKQEHSFCKAFVDKVVKYLKNTGSKMKNDGLLAPLMVRDHLDMDKVLEGRYQPRSAKFSRDQRFYKIASEYKSAEDCKHALALLLEHIRANGLNAEFSELANLSCLEGMPTGGELLTEDVYEDAFKDTPLRLPKLTRRLDSDEEDEKFITSKRGKRRNPEADFEGGYNQEGDDEDEGIVPQLKTKSSKQGVKRHKRGGSAQSPRNRRQPWGHPPHPPHPPQPWGSGYPPQPPQQWGHPPRQPGDGGDFFR